MVNGSLGLAWQRGVLREIGEIHLRGREVVPLPSYGYRRTYVVEAAAGVEAGAVVDSKELTAISLFLEPLVTLNRRHFEPAAATFAIEVVSPAEAVARLGKPK